MLSINNNLLSSGEDSSNLWNIYNNIRSNFSILEDREISVTSNIETSYHNNHNYNSLNKTNKINKTNKTRLNVNEEDIANKLNQIKQVTKETLNKKEDIVSVSDRISKNREHNVIAEVIDSNYKYSNMNDIGIDINIDKVNNDKISRNDIIRENERLSRRDINYCNSNKIDKSLYVNKSICNLCKLETMIKDDLKYVCVECGYINTQLISNSGECNDYFSSSTAVSMSSMRYGSVNPLLPQSSRATTMLSAGGRGKSYLARMQEWYNMPYSEKSLLDIFRIIDRKCNEDNLPTIIRDRAKLMFKVLKDEKILKREKPKYALIASCVYYSCKEKGIPKTTKELAKLFNISITQMTTGCKQYNEIMFHRNRDYLIKIKPITYIECINSLCKILDIADRFRHIIINIASVADRMGIVNDNIPPSIAVSSIFMLITMLKLPITKKTLSMRSNISEVTISKTYKKLYPYRKYLLTMKCL